MPDQREIVLVPIPFTDLSSTRRRPVIVVSNNDYNSTTADIVVVAMTSNPAVSVHSFIIQNADLERGTLPRPSRVRADKIYTIAQSIIVKTFGKVKSTVLDQIRDLMNTLATPTP